MIPGHEIPEVETVIERHDGYYLLRKDKGDPSELAEDLSERH